MAHSLNKAFIQAYRKSEASWTAESVEEETLNTSSAKENATEAEPAATPAPIEVPAGQPVAQEHATAASPAPATLDTGDSAPPQPIAQPQTVIAEPTSTPGEATEEVDSPVATTADDFDFMVRVDTASMEIPQPHFMRPRGTKQLVDVSAMTPDQPSKVQAEKAAPTVRDTIAQQMLASAEPLDSSQVFLVEPFWGSLPNVTDEQSTNTPAPENSASKTSTEVQSITAPEVQPKAAAQLPDSDGISVPATSDEQAEISQTHHDEIGDTPIPDVDMPDATNAEDSPTDFVSARDDSLGDFEDTRSDREELVAGDTNSFEPVELEAPAAPALSADEVRNLVEEYADRMSEKGEIFRLDAPSYQESAVGAEAEESEEPSSIVQQPPEVSGEDQASRRAAAYEAEEELRRVETQRFNPAWEVDEFHWPAVCNELTQMAESGLEQVAANLVRASEEGLHIMAVTSPQAGEGRTTVACCLAKLAGANGLRVAFVDGDVENPSLSSQTNLDIDFDWRTAIINQMPLEEVAIHSVEDEVTLVPLVQPVHETEIASDDNRIAYMLQELSDYFDLVIVDMGHMESAKSLVSGLGQQGIINAVVTVVDNRISSRERIESCLRRIRRSGISSVGLVENFAA